MPGQGSRELGPEAVPSGDPAPDRAGARQPQDARFRRPLSRQPWTAYCAKALQLPHTPGSRYGKPVELKWTPTDSNPVPSPDRHSLLTTQTGATSSPLASSSPRARACQQAAGSPRLVPKLEVISA